jgi:Phage Mu protein F like protein
MTQPADQQTQQPPPQGHPVAKTVGATVALSAIAHGLPDPFLPLRWRALSRVVAAERKMLDRYRAAITPWAADIGRRVVRGGVFDPSVILFSTRDYTSRARPAVEIVIREVFDDAARAMLDDFGTGWEPDIDVYSKRYLAGAWNKLSGVPDRVYDLVKREVATATREGDDLNSLAGRIEALFTEHDVPIWKNRSLTVARTETLAAYNAGSFAGMVASARQMGGAWDKVWLATEDERTRPTHVRADLQRVPLTAHFTVGGFPAMYPHDPTLPAKEVVSCRCTPLLVRHGEKLNTAGRQFKETA